MNPTTPRPVNRSGKPAWREFLESLLWAAAVALLIRTFLIAPFKIPSGSMRPALIEGDRILVNKLVYRFRDPRRGEIAVFRYPDDPKRPFIKRVVAMGGETVEVKDGHILVNGEPVHGIPALERTYYVNRGDFGQEDQTLEVPGDAFYVLGDNSSFSHDSRFWGFVPRRLLIGKAMCIFWPPWRIRLIQLGGRG